MPMITLRNLAHLTRPGDGPPRDVCRDEFWASPLVGALDWPTEVVEQFLFDHGTKDEFLTQYGHIDLPRLRWAKEHMRAGDVTNATVFEGFQQWLSNVEANPEFHMSRTEERQRGWAEHGSWVVPPLLIERAALNPPGAGLHVVEGHTRIGILRGLLTLRSKDPGDRLDVYVGRL